MLLCKIRYIHFCIANDLEIMQCPSFGFVAKCMFNAMYVHNMNRIFQVLNFFRACLFFSQPGISIYNVPLPTPENYRQLHRFRWESVLEISANNSAYEGPWQFWCTAKNMYGIRSRELSLTRPTPTAQPLPRQPVYIRSTPAPKEIVTQ